MIHYQHRSAPVEEGLEEACRRHLVELLPCPGRLAAGHRVSALAVPWVSTAFVWVAAAVVVAAGSAWAKIALVGAVDLHRPGFSARQPHSEHSVPADSSK